MLLKISLIFDFMQKQNFIKPIWAIGLVAVLLFLLNNLRPQPDYNWDSIPYSNLILKYDGQKNDSIRHAEVYAHLKENVPENKYKELAETDHWFRLQAYLNYKVLTEQLPFFAVKPLYILNAWAFYKMGFGLFKSTWIPSYIAFIFLTLLFFQFISKRHGNPVAFFAVIFIMITPPFLDAAKMGTPDLLGTLVTSLLVVFFLERRSWVWLFVLSIMAILIRPDHIILCGLIIGLKALEKQTWRERIILAGIPGISLLLIHFVNFSIHGNPGWKMMFMHSFQGNIHFPLSEGREWDWSLYIETLKIYFHQLGAYTWIALFPVLLTINKSDKLKEIIKRPEIQVLGVVLITIALKYFLHPLADRFHTPFYAIGVLLIVYGFGRNRVVG